MLFSANVWNLDYTFSLFNLAHIVSLSFQVTAAGGRRQSIVGTVHCVSVMGVGVGECVCVHEGRKIAGKYSLVSVVFRIQRCTHHKTLKQHTNES